MRKSALNTANTRPVSQRSETVHWDTEVPRRGLRQRGGNDVYDIGAIGTYLRLDFNDVGSGVTANLNSGRFSDDGDGGSDRITGSAMRTGSRLKTPPMTRSSPMCRAPRAPNGPWPGSWASCGCAGASPRAAAGSGCGRALAGGGMAAVLTLQALRNC